MSVLKIHHLGPITDCEINIKDFTILTGPQASGKSTVAKAIFFFRTAKQDFYDQLTTFSADEYHSTLEKDLKKRLRSKFIQIFGTSWAMPQDMRISYEFSHWVTISVYLSEDCTETKEISSISSLTKRYVISLRNIRTMRKSNGMKIDFKALRLSWLNYFQIPMKSYMFLPGEA